MLVLTALSLLSLVNANLPHLSKNVTGVKEEVHYRIGAVADRDEDSKIDNVTWGSYLKTGTLTVHRDHTISVKWDKEMVSLKSHISEKGRGVELSELIVFNGKLYTVDDRSGIGRYIVCTVQNTRSMHSIAYSHASYTVM